MDFTIVTLSRSTDGNELQNRKVKCSWKRGTENFIVQNVVPHTTKLDSVALPNLSTRNDLYPRHDSEANPSSFSSHRPAYLPWRYRLRAFGARPSPRKFEVRG